MSAHYLVAAIPVTSHLRASVWFSCNLLLAHASVYITVLVPSQSLMICEEHLTAFVGKNSEQSLPIRHRLQFVPVGVVEGADAQDKSAQIAAMAKGLPGVLSLFLSKSASATGFLRRPSLSFVDTFLFFYIDILHRVAGALKIDIKSVPTLILWPMPCSPFLHSWSSAASGGTILSTMAKIEKQNHYRSIHNAPAQDIADAFLNEILHPEGKLISFAGTPPMYDYERYPQLGSSAVTPPSIRRTYHLQAAMVRKAQGVVTLSGYEYEPGVKKAVESAFGGKCLQVGPVFPERWWAGSFDEPAHSPDNLRIMQFLDQAVTRFGKHSVLYISFGTLFFPAGRPDQIQLLIKSLLTANPPMPFIFGTAGAPSGLVDDISAMLAAEDDSALGIICGFAPQLFILNHAATGYFLTHGGANSIAESILTEKPMVLWPIMGDQPLNAAHLSTDLGIAIELIQVRTGPAVGRPTYHGIIPMDSPEVLMIEFAETWRRLRGTEGMQMMMKIRALNKATKESRQDGNSYEAIVSLGNWDEDPDC